MQLLARTNNARDKKWRFYRNGNSTLRTWLGREIDNKVYIIGISLKNYELDTQRSTELKEIGCF